MGRHRKPFLKNACPVVVFSRLLLAEIGTAAVIPKTGFLLRTTITERDVVGAVLIPLILTENFVST